MSCKLLVAAGISGMPLDAKSYDSRHRPIDTLSDLCRVTIASRPCHCVWPSSTKNTLADLAWAPDNSLLSKSSAAGLLSALTIMTLEVPPSYSVSSVIQDKSVCSSLSLSRVLRVVVAADMSGWASR